MKGHEIDGGSACRFAVCEEWGIRDATAIFYSNDGVSFFFLRKHLFDKTPSNFICHICISDSIQR